MVRSAMMLAAAFPEMRSQAVALTERLTELVGVMTKIRDQSVQLKAEMTRLTDARTRLSGLLEAKKVSLDERQSELKRMRRAAAEISDSVTDLNELISRLDKAVETNTGLGAYDAETKRQEQAKIAEGVPEAADPGGDEEDDDDAQPAAGAADQRGIAVAVAEVGDAEDVTGSYPGGQQRSDQHRRRQGASGNHEVFLSLYASRKVDPDAQ